MAELFLYGLNVVPGLKRIDCVTVPEVMEADIVQSQRGHNLLEVTHHGIVPDVISAFVGKNQIVLVMHDHRLRELNKTVKKDMEITFITMTDKDGKRAYRRSAVLLMQKAANNLWKNDVMIRVNHSLGQGYFCSMEGVELNKANILMLKEEMLRVVAQDYPIEKYNVNRDEAIELFEGFGLIDKKLTMEYRRNSRVNLYSVDGFVDYHFGFMVPSTGYIKWFDLDLYEKMLNSKD